MNAVSPVETLVTDHLDLWTAALKRKSTAGRGSSSKVELYGIRKLRELILELAVRGLLVPQDPNDEPASELLQKIAAEKAKLVKAGRVKREDALPAVTHEERPFELPYGWSCERIGNLVSKLGSGSTPRGGKEVYVSEGIRFLRSQNVRDDGIDLEDIAYISPETHEKMAGTRVLPGDVLLNITGASLGRSAIFPDQLVEANVSQHVTIIRLLLPEMARFVHLGVISPMIQKLVWGRQVGMAIGGLSKKVLEMFEFPIPPLPEQHRIVAKVDELMALCDQLEQQTEASLGAHQTLVETLLSALTSAADHAQFASAWQRIAGHFDTLFTTEESIAQLKQTILQLAVMGKLVPQDPNDEPASELLKKIAAEKAKLLKEGKIKKERPLPIIAVEDMQFELPAGWALTRLGSVIDLISGQHLGPTEYFESLRPGAIPYLTGPAEFGPKSPEPTRYTNERRAVSILGDILLTVKGSGVGKTNIVSQPEIAISRQLMALRSIAVDRNFLNILLATLAEKFQAQSVGIAIPGISREDVLEAPLYLPSFAEQHRIVAKVDELMALCDQLKSRLSDAQTTQLHLADALVEQAIC